MSFGANYLGEGKCRFEVWAPDLEQLSIRLASPGDAAGGNREKALEAEMEKGKNGIHFLYKEGVTPGTDYTLLLPDGAETPDPASYFQPEGVKGPSRIVDHSAFAWRDGQWQAPPMREFIIYEIHTGTFTARGDFQGIAEKIPHLLDLGVTALEIMPMAQFPGARNWGYDGVFPFAVQDSYGGSDGLKFLVDACHRAGLAVILDVVYNHFGPEGNVQTRFGPMLTDRYKTAWGQAINFDGPGSDGVREFFLQNALYWFRHFHADALRLDAVHAYMDLGCRHILQEISQRTRALADELGRPLYLIGESDLNDVKVVQARERGGWGLDAMWSDDLHHSLHAIVTGERNGYYEDFGPAEMMAKALREPHVYDGRFSKHRGRSFGNSARGFSGDKFVVCAQNHDQVGNRKEGDRLASLVPPSALRLAAISVLLSPYVPLLFMGEEYGEDRPFLYFADHSDPDLLQAVREGRKAEFSGFGWTDMPPDPFSRDTFLRCRLDWNKLERDGHRELFDFYKSLIRLRKEHPALKGRDPQAASVHFEEEKRLIVWERAGGGRRLKCYLNFSSDAVFPGDSGLNGTWSTLMRSGTADGNGSGRTHGGFSPEAGGAEPEFEKQSAAVAEAEMIEPWGFLITESRA